MAVSGFSLSLAHPKLTSVSRGLAIVDEQTSQVVCALRATFCLGEKEECRESFVIFAGYTRSDSSSLTFDSSSLPSPWPHLLPLVAPFPSVLCGLRASKVLIALFELGFVRESIAPPSLTDSTISAEFEKCPSVSLELWSYLVRRGFLPFARGGRN